MVPLKLEINFKQLVT